MPAVTRAELRSAIIFRADLPVAEPRRYTDVQLNGLISESVRRLQGALITWWGDDYFTQETQIALTAGTSDYTLPADIKIKTLIWLRDNAGTQRTPSVKLARVDLSEIHRFIYGGDRKWETSDPPRWYVDFEDPAYVLKFTYTSTQDENLRLYAVKEIAPFTDDADVINLQWGWEEWIVLDSMVTIRQRDKQEYQDILDERTRLEGSIATQAPEKGQSEVRTVRNVFPEDFSGPEDPRGFRW